LTEDTENHRYQCANPNCGKVFAKPKIIKYYVCPTCQTLVIMDTKIAETNEEIKKKTDSPTNENKNERRNRKKKTNASINEEPDQSVLTPNPSETTQSTFDTKLADLEKSTKVQTPIEINYQTETKSSISEPAKHDEDLFRDYFEPKTNSVKEDAIECDHKAIIAEKASDKSDSVCDHYFGYLGERDKTEQIPKCCSSCSKSVECVVEPLRKEVEQKVKLSNKDESEPPTLISEKPTHKITQATPTCLADLEASGPQQSLIILEPQLEAPVDKTEVKEQDEALFEDCLKLITTTASENKLTEDNPSEEAIVEKTSNETDFVCNHYFGYLSKRDRTEQIPEDCFACPKSVECMLESKENSGSKIEGIKKWYFSP
jgi:hypothetical protein